MILPKIRSGCRPVKTMAITWTPPTSDDSTADDRIVLAKTRNSKGAVLMGMCICHTCCAAVTKSIMLASGKVYWTESRKHQNVSIPVLYPMIRSSIPDKCISIEFVSAHRNYLLLFTSTTFSISLFLMSNNCNRKRSCLSMSRRSWTSRRA